MISGFNTFSVPNPDLTLTTLSTPVEEVELTTKEIVKDYFKDNPILVDIARCESNFTQENKDGKIHRGRVNRYDVGVMQINELYHADSAEKLGLDIYTLEGNLAFAKYLYEHEGARPWMASSACWAKYKEIARK